MKMFSDAKPTIWFVVENVGEEYHRLMKDGVQFLSKPYPIRTGTAVEFEDLFGYCLGLTDYRT